jgi:hypothetical protein
MNKTFKKLLIGFVKNDFFWRILKPMATTGIILNNLRLVNEKEENTFKSKIDSLFDSLTVLNGPFKGLKYSSLDSVGSSIYPKILGSYERELHKSLYEIFSEDYTEIIDVGCAEGYYAIGMARKFDNAKIYACDIDKRVQELCSKAAILNDVSDRVEIGAEVTPALLGSFEFTKKGLIICDCEGFEIELFNSHNIENLKQCDLIIELHDFINIKISGDLKKLFSKTHDIESIFSIDDIHKAQNYNYSELSGQTMEDKKKILGEGRPAIMEWVICRAKK